MSGPFRVGLDARMIGPVMTGLGRYALGLATWLPRLDPGNRYVVIRRAHAQEAARGIGAAPNVEEAIVEGDIDLPANLLAARAINRLGLDLYHSLYDFVPPGLRVPRIVLTLHDLTWLEQPDLCFDDRFAWLKARVTNLYARATMPYAARRAARVIAVSEHTRRRGIAALGLDPDRVHVVYHGVDREAFPPLAVASEAAPESRLPRDPAGTEVAAPFFLCLGNTKPYKNTRAAIAAFAMVAAERRDCRLLIAGRGDSRRNLEQLARRLGVADRVVFAGALSHAALLDRLHGAVALVFPSLVEGFGLPLIEAMSAGCPVVGSAAATVAEICGDAALLPDPFSPAAIAEAMRAVMSDARLRARLRDRGFQRAACFGWDACAGGTLSVYRAVLEDR
jgi:glycosyltransferase involved in cell wall biosynthesis